MTIFILLLIYIISTLLMYKYIQLSVYHPRGVDKGIDIKEIHYYMTFTPIANTVICILAWFIQYPIEKDYTNNIFKPKSK